MRITYFTSNRFYAIIQPSPLYKRLGEPQSRSVCYQEEKKSLLFHALPLLNCTANSLVAIFTNSYLLFCAFQVLTDTSLPFQIIERFQSKALRMIVDEPWYVPNTVIRRDLQIPTVKAEIRHYSYQYSVLLSAHPNDLTLNLIELPDNRRL
jgi:hypothetical protein